MVFITGNFSEGRSEAHLAGIAEDLAAESVSEGIELGSGQGGRVALGQFGFESAELLAQVIDARGESGEPLLLEGFEFDGAQVWISYWNLRLHLMRVGLETLSSSAMLAKLQPCERSCTNCC